MVYHDNQFSLCMMDAVAYSFILEGVTSTAYGTGEMLPWRLPGMSTGVHSPLHPVHEAVILATNVTTLLIIDRERQALFVTYIHVGIQEERKRETEREME